MQGRAKDWSAAKDIRIFGLRPWLEEIYGKTLAAYMAFKRRRQNAYIWSRIADIILTFLRNGIAYAYLIHLVLSGGLGVAGVFCFSFLPSAVLPDGFREYSAASIPCTGRVWIFPPYESAWNIGAFAFEEGEPLRAQAHRMYEIKLENVTFRYPGGRQRYPAKYQSDPAPRRKARRRGTQRSRQNHARKAHLRILRPDAGAGAARRCRHPEIQPG